MGKASRARQEKIAKVLELREIEAIKGHARLYDRLAQGVTVDWYDERIRWIKPEKKHCVIIADNVADYIRQDWRDKKFWFHGFVDEVLSEFSLVRPPFYHTFIEFKFSQFTDVGIELTYTQDGDEYEALFFHIHIGVKGYPEGERYKTYDDVPHFIQLDGDGQIDIEETRASFTEEFSEYIDEYDEGEKGLAKLLNSRIYTLTLTVALKTIELLNCRNVELIDSPPPDPALAASYEHHFGQPMTRYKLLRIKPTRKEYDTEREGDPLPSHKALHIVRGNFAQYTDTAPLFGKYVGTFWRPAHVRGEEKYGVVVKDYAVDAPDSN